MKILFACLVLGLVSCGENSSPEGRMNAKIETLQRDIDSLKVQNKLILERIEGITPPTEQ